MATMKVHLEERSLNVFAVPDLQDQFVAERMTLVLNVASEWLCDPVQHRANSWMFSVVAVSVGLCHQVDTAILLHLNQTD